MPSAGSQNFWIPPRTLIELASLVPEAAADHLLLLLLTRLLLPLRTHMLPLWLTKLLLLMPTHLLLLLLLLMLTFGTVTLLC